MINAEKSMTLRSPVSGRIIPLDQVPDPVFAQKILGDGVAIEPTDGKIYAPVDAQITAMVEDLHTYCFTTDAGLELLIHVGLDTADLKAEGFANYAEEGERVRAGQLIAEVDLGVLKRKGVSAVTILLVCSDPNQWNILTNMGEVMGGMTPALILQEKESAEEQTLEEPKNKQAHGFLQKLKFIMHTSRGIS